MSASSTLETHESLVSSSSSETHTSSSSSETHASSSSSETHESLSSQKRKRRRKTYFCGHCKRILPKSTFYRHRELYYDELCEKWTYALFSSADESEGESEDESEDERQENVISHSESTEQQGEL